MCLQAGTWLGGETPALPLRPLPRPRPTTPLLHLPHHLGLCLQARVSAAAAGAELRGGLSARSSPFSRIGPNSRLGDRPRAELALGHGRTAPRLGGEISLLGIAGHLSQPSDRDPENQHRSYYIGYFFFSVPTPTQRSVGSKGTGQRPEKSATSGLVLRKKREARICSQRP